MSKASEWVKKCADARACGPGQFVGTKLGRAAAIAEVDYKTGHLKLVEAALTAEEALKLAAWIVDTFGEAPDVPK